MRAAGTGEVELNPHRLERYMASNDPQFEEKAADMIGLYTQRGAADRPQSARLQRGKP
jgi:hypothetical protein